MGALLLWRELSLHGSCWVAPHGPGQLAAADVVPVHAAEPCARRRGSLAEFLKELPVAVKRAEPNLALLFGDSPPLERRLRLRELQSVFVYSTVLAKKCRVRHARLGCGFCSHVGVLAIEWIAMALDSDGPGEGAAGGLLFGPSSTGPIHIGTGFHST